LDDKARCFREMLHPAEEAELSPSHQVYFSGCNLRCGYCTVPEWNAQPLTVPEMDLENWSGPWTAAGSRGPGTSTSWAASRPSVYPVFWPWWHGFGRPRRLF